MGIKETMSRHHRFCDEAFALAETAVSKKDWDQANQHFSAFIERTNHHFNQEEQVLFPEFEAATGMTMGPTQIMRSEHAQMRQLFDDMAEALNSRDRNQYLGLSETLMMIMQQHNMKEEQILYPMADQALAGHADQTLARMHMG